MAIDSGDRAADEYKRAADYIRKLCEVEEDAGLDQNTPVLSATNVGPLDSRLDVLTPVSEGNPKLLFEGLALPIVSASAPMSPADLGQTMLRSRTRSSRIKSPVDAAKAAASLAGGEVTFGDAAVAATKLTGGAKRQANGGSSSNNCNNNSSKNGHAHVSPDDHTHDVCDACGQPGQFICCELCPRVFHFLCVNPPMTLEAVNQTDHWYCRQCAHRVDKKRKSRAHAKNILYPLISSIDRENPRVFSIPEDIRRQFDGIEADVDGSFVDTRKAKQLRVNYGPTNRDFTRLVDDHHDPIMCYRCGTSALHGPVIRCDYCPLNWHWDCLDPPMAAAPPARKRWMCPNHADHAIQHRHRKFRKERIVDLTDLPEDPRNGIVVDIIDDDPPWQLQMQDPKVKYRISSSRVRREFSRNARPCRVQASRSPSPKDRLYKSEKGVDTSEPESAEQQVQPASSSVAEWLQSIVAFQQDVARFIMGTTEPAVLLPAPSTSLYHGSNHADSATTERLSTGDSKLAALSLIADEILAPLRVEAKRYTNGEVGGVEPSSSLSANAIDTSSLDGTLTDANMDIPTLNLPASDMHDTAASALTELPMASVSTRVDTDVGRERRLLGENGVSRHDLEAALNDMIDSWPAETTTTTTTTTLTNIRAVCDGSAEYSIFRKAENPLGGALRKRKSRSSSLGSVRDFKRPRMVGYLSSPQLLDPNDVVDECVASDDRRKRPASARASLLIRSLARTKGAGALLDFLLS
ncbi:hypothetical protein GGI15_003564 [Coemansia interrupta]|uniref:PHD-type domain-containing protein n=1 Tax=Coemansia interrupta TaxID=1126814 RepID=A0A9W8H6V1_9FUNG|nr:hypothetical protein GGI15_003564 [Coemansia interrupta]